MCGDRQIHVFGGFLLGHEKDVLPFMARPFESEKELQTELLKIGGILDSGGNTTIDSETGLVVKHRSILNRDGQVAGSFDLVEASETELYDLKKSAGHFDISE